MFHILLLLTYCNIFTYILIKIYVFVFVFITDITNLLRRLFYYKFLNLSTFLFPFFSFSNFYYIIQKQIPPRICFLYRNHPLCFSFSVISVHSEHRTDLLIYKKYDNRHEHTLKKIKRRNGKHYKCKQICNM